MKFQTKAQKKILAENTQIVEVIHFLKKLILFISN